MARDKQYLEQNVLDAARERVRYIYKRFDNVVVSFSGGKDSTAVLNIAIEVARELNRLPIKAIFVDEEAIHPTTVEYVERVRANKDVQLDWYCLPVKHRNACSNEQPFWYTWNPAEKHLWVRELPMEVLTEEPHFNFGDSFQDWMPKIFPNEMGSVCVLTGIRTQESLRRYRVIISKKNDSFINARAEYKNAYKAHPIYDWSSEDVWRYVAEYNLDYNRTYDIFNKTSLYNKLLTQRVCPPYGEEPLRGLWVYAECWPELWHKMINRVKGVNTAWRYANTELYSNTAKPDNLTWKEYLNMVLETYTETEYREMVRQNINETINAHYNKTNAPIKEDIPNPLTGCSWKFLCKLAIKGDFKGRQVGSILQESEKIRKKLNLSVDDVKRIYGKKGKYGEK